MSDHLVLTVLERLYQSNPNPRIELNFTNPFELLIATILAAQCTDERVNRVTKTFFKEYPTPASIIKEEPEVIAEKIKSTGFYRNKSKNIIACCEKLQSEYGGKVPDNVEALAQLPGVGRKTANIVLGNAYGQQAIAVDTHVKRVSQRLKLTESNDPDVIEQELMPQVPVEKWTLFTQLVVLHGRYTCQAKKPNCGQCVLNDICPWEEKSHYIANQ
jgi:endonuclease-3